jgi:hypothetical protein
MDLKPGFDIRDDIPNEDECSSVELLFANIKKELPRLTALLDDVNKDGNYDDCVYRFYHQSFKVFRTQRLTVTMVEALKRLLPDRELNAWFMQIYEQGTGKKFDPQKDNRNWLPATRPILEAFFHAKYFLEMVVKFGNALDSPPGMLPFGWGAVLYLYNLRFGEK